MGEGPARAFAGPSPGGDGRYSDVTTPRRPPSNGSQIVSARSPSTRARSTWGTAASQASVVSVIGLRRSAPELSAPSTLVSPPTTGRPPPPRTSPTTGRPPLPPSTLPTTGTPPLPSRSPRGVARSPEKGKDV